MTKEKLLVELQNLGYRIYDMDGHKWIQTYVEVHTSHGPSVTCRLNFDLNVEPTKELLEDLLMMYRFRPENKALPDGSFDFGSYYAEILRFAKQHVNTMKKVCK